jgi:tRNA A37 methylthiotransferase MiaB
LVLVSENSTSYGKDLANLRALETLLPDLAAIDGIERVRVSYLQPAELRPSLVEVIATTPGVAAYFDLSFQHASETVLRRMKRFGSSESFLDLLARARALAPDAGARSNIIVGFPGETEEDLSELEYFLQSARLDAVGVFGYSDEEGTEAVDLPGKVDPDEIADRVARITALVDELVTQRAEDRVGSRVELLIERRGEAEDGEVWFGRAAHQGADGDGSTTLTRAAGIAPGDMVAARVLASDGVDLICAPLTGVRARRDGDGAGAGVIGGERR